MTSVWDRVVGLKTVPLVCLVGGQVGAESTALNLTRRLPCRRLPFCRLPCCRLRSCRLRSKLRGRRRSRCCSTAIAAPVGGPTKLPEAGWRIGETARFDPCYARHMTWIQILEERETFSRIRLDQVRNGIASIPAVSKLPNLAIFAAGSYARHEASRHSDLDLFFVYGPNHDTANRRTLEFELFGALISLARQVSLPEFSNDAEYLQTHESDKMLEHLGSPADDAYNFFTLRMLMLLESECLAGEEAYNWVINQIIESYYRDYPDHQASFQPWFLVNDVARFWKTLLLNYEHRRNQPVEDEGKKTKQKVRNFKLKYSRMTTCFATIAALGTYQSPVRQDDVVNLIRLTPHDRLRLIQERQPALSPLVDEILESYAWFLTMTGLTTEELESQFADKAKRVEMFKRANLYGDLMYRLIEVLDEQPSTAPNRMRRFLVI